MTDSSKQFNEINQLVDSWMQTMNHFWRDISAQHEDKVKWDGVKLSFDSDGDEDDDRYRTYRAWEASINNTTSLMRLMMAPENQEALAKSLTNYTEAMTQAAGDSLENFLDFQGSVIKSMAKVGEHTKAYSLEDLDHSAFESFRELYRTELQKYLLIPKIGLPRETHELLSRLADKSNIFSSYLIELLYMFYLPLEKTQITMQRKTRRMLESGEIEDDAKLIYNEWIKVLEGNYMHLLQSREYTQVLNNTISSLAEYKDVKNSVIDLVLKEMQIPTNKEMDEVYREMYQMKKKIRELSRQVEELKNNLSVAS